MTSNQPYHHPQPHPHQLQTEQNPLTSNYPPRHLASSTNSPTASDYDSPASSLPRYTAPNSANHGRQPLNNNLAGPRPFPTHHHPPHPLSHATYADSASPEFSDTPNGLSINTPTTVSGRSFEKTSSASDSPHHAYQPAPTHLTNANMNSSQYSLSARSTHAYPNRREVEDYGLLARIHRAWTGASVADSGLDERHVKKKRLGYLDGLKFLASIVVLNGTLFDAVLTENDYKLIQRGSPLYIFRSTNLGISMLLLLSGRCLIAPLWDAPNPQAKFLIKNQDPHKPLVSWPRLTRAMLIRPFRFLLPVIAVAALQWGLASGGDHRATKKCNDAGMTEPYWANIDRIAGFFTLFFDLFTYFEQDTVAGKAFGANLWTVPWFFQASYAVYVTHFMLGNLPSNRYWVYGILMLFSWTSLNYFALPMMGLLIADMAAHGQTAKMRKMPLVTRLGLRLVLLILALSTQFIGPVRNHLNSAMGTINVQSHKEITFADWIFVTVVLLIVETSEVAQLILSNVVFRLLSRLSAGMYLLAPAITFTIVPMVALKLHDTQTYQASGVLGLSWLVLIGVAMTSSIGFYFFIECPSKLIGEWVVDWVEKMGVDRELMKKDAEDLKALTAGHK